MRIEADLDGFETESLFDILHHEIVKYSIQSKLRYLNKEITKSRFEWDQAHAKYLEGIKTKLLTKHYEAAKKREKALKARTKKS